MFFPLSNQIFPLYTKFFRYINEKTVLLKICQNGKIYIFLFKFFSFYFPLIFYIAKFMTLDLTQKPRIHRLTLIHQTNIEAAESIIISQSMHPGVDGAFGAGIYFANTIQAASVKANHQGTFLVADVYIGQYYPCPVSQYQVAKANTQTLKNNGYTGVIGYQMIHGREIVAFYPYQVKNIKYCYGQRPNAIFRTTKSRLTLFIVTNRNDASNIVRNQRIPKTNGPFGYAIYLYDSITDALTVHPNEETYLMADVHMKDFHPLKHVVDVNSPKIPHKCRTFYGRLNNIQYFMIKDGSLIKNIHFCGGQNWN